MPSLTPPLMPRQPRQRHRVRMYNKLIDEYVHNSCTILTFATAFRPRLPEDGARTWQAEINKSPLKRRTEYKRSVIEHGLDSEFVVDALGASSEAPFVDGGLATRGSVSGRRQFFQR